MSEMKQNGFSLRNRYLEKVEFLYHFGISTDDEIMEKFKDVKFVCLGGKSSRMKNFAGLLYDLLCKPANSVLNPDGTLKDISEAAGRYAMYKVGPAISVSHGIGSASLSVVLHEIIKLVAYAGCKDVKFIRIGSSGGLGVEPGTVVITRQPYDGLLNPHYTQKACGKEITNQCATDPTLADHLLKTASKFNINAIIGNTIGTDDFYEEQGRLDGAVCEHTSGDKMMFLKRAHDEFGIRNIEMESVCMGALCHRANIKCAVVCVTLLNRLHGDAVTSPGTTIKKWELAPQRLVAEYVKSHQ